MSQKASFSDQGRTASGSLNLNSSEDEVKAEENVVAATSEMQALVLVIISFWVL